MREWQKRRARDQAKPDDIISQLIRDEGFIASAYQDPLGYWTIGSGICIDARKGCGITDEENVFLMQDRLTQIETQIAEQLPWTVMLDPVRLAVLWNMAYQMGLSGLLGFKDFLGSMQQGNWAGAAQNMLKSLWAEQTPARANRLALQVETGNWE